MGSGITNKADDRDGANLDVGPVGHAMFQFDHDTRQSPNQDDVDEVKPGNSGDASRNESSENRKKRSGM